MDSDYPSRRFIRSRVILAVIERYLTEGIDAAIDRQIVEAYTRMPQGQDPAWEAALRASIADEPW